MIFSLFRRWRRNSTDAAFRIVDEAMAAIVAEIAAQPRTVVPKPRRVVKPNTLPSLKPASGKRRRTHAARTLPAKTSAGRDHASV